MHRLLLSVLFVVCFASLSAQTGPKTDLSVFPNPATDYFSVDDQHDAVGHIFVFNLVGKKVKEFVYNKGEQYFIADLPKGMYLVQIRDHNHRVLTTHKIDKR